MGYDVCAMRGKYKNKLTKKYKYDTIKMQFFKRG